MPAKSTLVVATVVLGIGGVIAGLKLGLDSAADASSPPTVTGESDSPLFKSDRRREEPSYLGQNSGAPEWQRADWKQAASVVATPSGDPEVIAVTPVGPFASSSPGNGAAACSVGGPSTPSTGNGGTMTVAVSTSCSARGTNPPQSPNANTCSAVDQNTSGGSQVTMCTAGTTMGSSSSTTQCSASGNGSDGGGQGAACSAGGSGLTGTSATGGAKCSAGQGSTESTCSTWNTDGHLSCSVGGSPYSNPNTCTAMATSGSSGSTFCSVNENGPGGTAYGNKCSVSGYPGASPGNTQSCSVLNSGGGTAVTCSVKAGTTNGMCTSVDEGNPGAGQSGSCSAGNSGTTIVCSVIYANPRNNTGPGPNGRCGSGNQH